MSLGFFSAAQQSPCLSRHPLRRLVTPAVQSAARSNAEEVADGAVHGSMPVDDVVSTHTLMQFRRLWPLWTRISGTRCWRMEFRRYLQLVLLPGYQDRHPWLFQCCNLFSDNTRTIIQQVQAYLFHRQKTCRSYGKFTSSSIYSDDVASSSSQVCPALSISPIVCKK